MDDTPPLLVGGNVKTPLRLAPIDDIVTRLQEMLDGPVPMDVSRQDIRDALLEIERLNAKVRSQALELLVAHSELLGLYDITMVDQQTSNYVDSPKDENEKHL